MGELTTCSIPGCGRGVLARGWCGMHYKRWKAHGNPEGRAVRTVKPKCSVADCGTDARARGLCDKHYQRLRKYGDANAKVLERTPNSGPCSVAGCDNPMRKRSWCASHYAQWTREGAVRPFRYKWRAERGACESCGREVPGEARTRRFCSDSCARIFYAGGGSVEADVECRRCGDLIDRRPRGDGRWVRDDILLCRACRHARAKHYGASASELAKRDGTDCSLCGEPVDMALTRADGVMCPSVDHVHPYSLGGSNDAENLALAHLKCNQLKLNRVGWSAIV